MDFLKRTKTLKDPKIQTCGSSPYQIVEKDGEHSFVIQVTQKSTQEAHTSQINPVLPTNNKKSVYHRLLTGGYFFVYPSRSG